MYAPLFIIRNLLTQSSQFFIQPGQFLLQLVKFSLPDTHAVRFTNKPGCASTCVTCEQAMFPCTILVQQAGGVCCLHCVCAGAMTDGCQKHGGHCFPIAITIVYSVIDGRVEAEPSAKVVILTGATQCFHIQAADRK